MDGMSTVMDAIGLYQTQYGQVDTIWGYYSVVTLAVVGFVLGSDKAVRTMREPLAIVGAYLVFCIGNHLALREEYAQLRQLSDIAIKLAEPLEMDISSFEPMPQWLIQGTHAAFVIAVCAGVLFVARSRIRARDKSAA